MNSKSMLATLDDVGYCYLPEYVRGNAHPEYKIMDLMLCLSAPLHVYSKQPFWKELPADTTRPRSRSGGIGLNSLHIDLINLENPPDFVFFHCVRHDPARGGATLACSLRGLENAIPAEILDELKRPIYRDGAAYDLDGVGEEINPFPIYDPDSAWPWRYSGRILETIAEQDLSINYELLVEFDRILMNRAVRVDMLAGDVMIVNQRMSLHGRLPMGPNQEQWVQNERRLVIQAYGRR